MPYAVRPVQTSANALLPYAVRQFTIEMRINAALLKTQLQVNTIDIPYHSSIWRFETITLWSKNTITT